MTAALLAEYAVLFGWSFLAATVLPLGSEVAFSAIVHRHGAWALPVLVATTGNSLGAFTTYGLGRRAAAFVEAAPGPPTRARRAAEALRRHGHPLLFFSWVPVLGDVLVAAAGAAQLPLVPVAAWVIGGKLLRYLMLAWVVRQVG